jgi:phytoene/squalene synthetase
MDSYSIESSPAAHADTDQAVGAPLLSVRRLVRRSSPFTYFISWLMPKRNRRFFWAWYAYIRWVDDFVDESQAPQSERVAFVGRQLKLVRELYERRAPHLREEEALLSALVSFDLSRGAVLRRPLVSLLRSIRFDGRRRGGPTDHVALHHNHRREVVSWLSTIAYFCDVPITMLHPPGAEAAVGAKIAHVVRDFLADCDQGLFNVSLQELAAYGLDPGNMRNSSATLPMRRWVAANVRIAEHHLRLGLRNVVACPIFRYRLIVAILIAKYRTYLDEFRARRFLLRRNSSLHRGRFLRHLLANIAVVSRIRSPPTFPAEHGRQITDLVQSSIFDRLLLSLTLHPWRNRAITGLLRDSLRDLDVSDPDGSTICLGLSTRSCIIRLRPSGTRRVGWRGRPSRRPHLFILVLDGHRAGSAHRR